jgi:hypothetical protein
MRSVASAIEGAAPNRPAKLLGAQSIAKGGKRGHRDATGKKAQDIFEHRLHLSAFWAAPHTSLYLTINEGMLVCAEDITESVGP